MAGQKEEGTLFQRYTNLIKYDEQKVKTRQQRVLHSDIVHRILVLVILPEIIIIYMLNKCIYIIIY